MAIEDLTDAQRARLARRQESLEGYETVIARCRAKIAKLDTKGEALERKIIQMEHCRKELLRVAALAENKS